MTAVWQSIYTSSSTYAYLVAGAEIDLTPMQAGDIIEIRYTKVLVSGGAAVVRDMGTYSGVQPVTHKTVHIGFLLDVYGVTIDMRQTAGVLRTIDLEVFDAVR
jgi:hypothetical protein